jgi:hypothetical protein
MITDWEIRIISDKLSEETVIGIYNKLEIQ